LINISASKFLDFSNVKSFLKIRNSKSKSFESCSGDVKNKQVDNISASIAFLAITHVAKIFSTGFIVFGLNI
jgi:hypothetical protein